MRYLVRWEMDFEDVESPQQAAECAWEAMRRDGSIANVFEVIDEEHPTRKYIVDLVEETIQTVSDDGAEIR
jgi:hypothetical protein